MSFKNIYGQDKQIAILKCAMKTERVAHAYLFCGMKGIGKRSTAGVFAKALNCKGGGIDPCGSCSSCRKIDHGVYPDVITIESEGVFIKIQDIRDLQNQIKFKPFEGRKRVFMIVDAEKMSIPSANALLKTLEEPNPSNILILVTSRPYLLPGTIISRCQKIQFNPVRKDTIISFLEDRTSLDRNSASLLASSARGSIGKALEMMRESYLTVKNEVIEKLVDWESERDPLIFFSFVDDFGEDRKEITERLNVLMDWYRDMLVYKETGETDRLINQDIINITRQFSERLSGYDILKSVKAINQAYTAIEQNANKQLTLESMMFKLFTV